MTTPSFPQCVNQSSKPHKFCPGCGHPIVLKSLGFVIDELKIAEKTVLGLDIGCALLAWDFFNIDTIQTHHGRTIPTMVGFKMAKPDTITIAYLGDGGAYAIGAQHLCAAAERDDNITVIVINNTLYAMTGGQMAPTTICNEKTETTPLGRQCVNQKPFQGPEMIAALADKDVYIARGIVSNPLQLRIFIKKALENQIQNRGFSFIEVLSMCPLNWKTDAKQTLEFLEKEMTKYFAVGEIKLNKVELS
jgi:2-oxoglutarate ferredoxin oxidoreductase subunit beta